MIDHPDQLLNTIRELIILCRTEKIEMLDVKQGEFACAIRLTPVSPPLPPEPPKPKEEQVLTVEEANYQLINADLGA